MDEQNNSVNIELVREHADTIIMRILSEQDRYGYEILDILNERSHGRYSIKQPTLYNALKRLEKLGYITSYFGDESNGGRRKYYTITEKGSKTLHKDQREWEFSRTVLDNLLSDKAVDLKSVEPPFELNELKPATKRIKIPDNKDASAQSIVIPITLEAKVANGTPIELKSDKTTKSQAEIDALIEEKRILEQKLAEEKRLNEEKQAEEKRLLEEKQAEQKRIEEQKIAEENRILEQKLKEERRLLEEKRQLASKILFEKPQENDENLMKSDSENLKDSAITKEALTTGKESSAKDTAKKEKPVQIEFKEAVASDIFVEKFVEKEGFINEKPYNPYEDNRIVSEKTYSFNEKPQSYKDAFINLFEKKPVEPDANSTRPPIKIRHFNDLKQELMDEDVKLKAYSKANMSQYYHMRYIFQNKILRDASLLLFLMIIVQLLVFFIAKSAFQISNTAIFVLGGISASLPIAGLINYYLFKEKRARARFNIKNSLINSLIALVIVATLFTIATLMPFFNIDFSTGWLYAVYILMLNIPISVLIYGLLYNSKNYHIKD